MTVTEARLTASCCPAPAPAAAATYSSYQTQLPLLLLPRTAGSRYVELSSSSHCGPTTLSTPRSNRKYYYQNSNVCLKKFRQYLYTTLSDYKYTCSWRLSDAPSLLLPRRDGLDLFEIETHSSGSSSQTSIYVQKVKLPRIVGQRRKSGCLQIQKLLPGNVCRKGFSRKVQEI